MDYDDNDFQSQNIHLAGEGSNKFPPVLQPYALPKFEFDDSLHGPLRFDSLVETEVFLGIESSEDNQWIEDFSRGSTGIQFSSSPAESCPISRCNNVWSEATSRESVEMLLKSVGQEEIALVQTNTRESDACDELGCMIKHMEPNSREDNKAPSEVGKTTNLLPTLLPCDIPENFPGAGNDIRGQQPRFEDNSYTQKDDASIGGGLGDLTAITVGVRLRDVEVSSFGDGKCSSSNQMEADRIGLDGSVDNMTHKEKDSTSGTQVDSIVHPIIIGSDDLNNDDTPNNVYEKANENNNVLETDIGVICEEQGVLTQEVQMDDKSLAVNVTEIGISHLENPLSSAPVESAAAANMIETKLNNSAEPSSIKEKGDSGSYEALDDQSQLGMHEVSMVNVEGNFTFETHKVEEPYGSQLDEAKTTSEPGAHVLSVAHDKASIEEYDGTGSKDEGGIPNLTVECSSAEAVFETHAESQDSSIAVESMQLDNKSMELGQHDIPKHDKDVPFEEKKNTEFPSDGNKMESQTVASLVINRESGSGTFGESGTESESLVSKLSSDSAAENGLAPSEDCTTTVSVLNQKDSGMSSLPTEVDIQRISAETNLSDLKSSSQETSGLDPVSELEKGNSSSIAQEELCKSGDQLLPTVDPCNSENQSEPQEAVTNNIRQESTELMEICRAVSDNANKGDGSEALTRESYGLVSSKASEPTVSNDEMLAKDESRQDSSPKILKEISSKSSDASEAQVAIPITKECGSCADLEKSASVSDSAGGCSELSQKESKKDGVKESTKQVVSVSETVDFGGSTICGVSCDPKLNDSSKDERSFTFEVRPLAELPEKVDGEIWKPFPDVQATKAPLPADASPSTPNSGQLNPKISQDVPPSTPNSGQLNSKISQDVPPSTPNSGQLNSKISQDVPPGISKVSGAAVGSRGSKGNTERKPRRASSKATAKDSAKKGGSRVTGAGKLERREKGNNLSVGPPGFPQLVPSSEMPRYGLVDSGGLKPFALTPSTAGLPDLNSSASPVALFQQPFTDLQQVQLRAQIFVYGALIQGTAPDEAYMISAFGGLDGGKSIWENAWRSRIERINGQRSHLTTPETPLQSRSGARTHDQGAKQSGVQSKAMSSPVGRASSKGTPTTAVNSLVPPSSPLWSLPTPSADTLQSAGMPRGPVMEYQRTLSPLHPHQTPPMRSFVGPNPSWISQAPFVGPWVASPQTSALDSSVRFSVQFPMTEPVQLTTVKESSVPYSSGAKHVSPGPLLPSGATTAGVFTASPVASVNKVTGSGQPSNDPKPRKRKKSLVSDPPALVVLPQTQMETVPIPTVTGYQPTSAAMPTPVSFVSNAPTEKFSTSASSFSTDLRTKEQNAGRRAILSEETLGKVKEARVQAEDAAAVAAAAVTHSQEIWNQLDKQKNSELPPDVETKLASAAVAIAAAAAVAKAAAAAANVASNAAIQAKLMADEAVISGGYSNFSQSNVSSAFEGTKNLGRTSPASILKGDDGSNSSSSILVAAREAAKRRVEAASAAAKRAENMDAIVKAAELAAEAVSQAGKIVAMGDPFSLSELVAAGPEGYWKVAQVTSEVISKPNDVGRENVVIDSIGEGPDKSTRSLKGSPSDKKETQITNLGKLTTIREMSTEEDHVKLTDGLSGSVTASVRDAKRQKGRKTSDLDKTIGSVPESESGSRSSIHDQEDYQKVVENSKENGIREGSLVEVYKDGSGFKAAWFSANVLSLKDGKAYVSYSDLAFGEGLEKLKEWVALQGENGVPRIRNARPVTVIPFEGTRKRRRAAVGDYNWSVGDKVDAWIQDSWWEGVITEKSTKDETMLTVHFPVQGETSVVRAWHLRPSLMWKNGQWIEWSSSRQNNSASNGDDTRQEKRPRLRSPALEVKGKDKEPKGVDVSEPDKHNEPTLLDLSADDKLFNIGKSTRDQSKSDALRMTRTGLQKEGSRVIFGVPKPGKKRKFMEVSRHYVAHHSSKDNESTDSVKFSKYPMTEGFRSRGWKNMSKTEPSERLATLARPKALKSGKPPSGSGRTIPQKENSLSTSLSTSDAAVTDRIVKTKNTVSHAENTSGKNNLEFQPFSSEGAAGGAVVFSSKALPSGTSSKKLPTSNAKSERASKGKLAPAGGKLGKIEEEKVFNGSSARTASDVVEPRRSNRRIQPTSRLLEGLQSSLMVSKIPSISHDKVQKSRSASRGNSHG